MLQQPVVVLVSLRSSVCSWSVWQARLSHPLNLTLWNLQTSCRGTTFHNLPTNTLRVPQCSWCSPVGTYPPPSRLSSLPCSQRAAAAGRRLSVGVLTALPNQTAALWREDRLSKQASPCTSCRGRAQFRAVIFGRRITLCHEMDLLILLCMRVCVFVCAYVRWYDL